MRSTNKANRPRGGTSRKLLVAVAVMSLSLAAVTGPAIAKKFSGSKRGETITGSKSADKIKGKGGSDKLKGRGGADMLNGGKGRDKLTGGAGADRHLGGPGNDTLLAADGRRDKVINGGKGRNTCVIDTALELSLVKGCSKVIAGSGPRGGGGGGAGDGLTVLNVDGIVCDTPLPLCVFAISGEGADALVGLITPGEGAVLGVGAAVTVTGTDWTAVGAYGCTGDGFLKVTIGSKSVDVPVDCTV